MRVGSGAVSDQVFINYWIGQEPTPPSPGLGQMPAQVHIAPLAFVSITDDYALDFSFLCTTNSAEQIQAWIKEVRANGTKVLFSINDVKLGTIPDIPAFVAGVVEDVVTWGVDGIDFDWEPPTLRDDGTLVPVVAALRQALDERLGSCVLTAPVWSPWQFHPQLLKDLAAELDYVTTMDYTPYQGLEETQSLVNTYVAAIGTPSKIVVGVSCMEPPNNFTPLADVVTLCGWEPDSGAKGGMMLYTYSYDITTRKGGGTGEPDFAFTQAIIANLP